MGTAASSLRSKHGETRVDRSRGEGCRVCSEGPDVPEQAAAAVVASAASTATTKPQRDGEHKSSRGAQQTGDGHDAQRFFAYMHSGCPLNRREVGRATWAFLHTLAAYYPEEPSKEMQEDTRQFMLLMGRLYPCGYCADRTSEEMIRNPPQVANRTEFARWMCEIHNEVNDRLGQSIFDCDRVEERWRTGPPDGSCD